MLSPVSFISPCLPSSADRPPSGPEWVHEIKHDGFRLMARRDPVGIRLLTKNGHDWAQCYPRIVEAVNALRLRSCLLDGEAVACGDDGLPASDRLRRTPASSCSPPTCSNSAGETYDAPLEVRKSTLASVLRRAGAGVQLTEDLEHKDGQVVFGHACKLGLKGIVSKRKGSPYRSGRSPDWLKFKNPDAVKREAKKD
jgi:bifunctional non-homologous end joining protein LigD